MMMTMFLTEVTGPSDPCSTAVHMKPFGLQGSYLNMFLILLRSLLLCIITETDHNYRIVLHVSAVLIHFA